MRKCPDSLYSSKLLLEVFTIYLLVQYARMFIQKVARGSHFLVNWFVEMAKKHTMAKTLIFSNHLDGFVSGLETLSPPIRQSQK